MQSVRPLHATRVAVIMLVTWLVGHVVISGYYRCDTSTELCGSGEYSEPASVPNRSGSPITP
jgi:hypothetical protein